MCLCLLTRSAIADPWPGDGGTEIGYGLPATYEPSGIVWHEGLEVLFVVSDSGYLSCMRTDGSGVTTWYIGGDLEGLAITDSETPYLYIGVENPDAIERFDITTGSLTGDIWDLTPWMQGPPNQGLEGLTFVPNMHHPYPPAASGGLFYAALQANGKIYVFDVDLSAGESVACTDSITPVAWMGDLSGLHYEPLTETLYAIYDFWNIILEMRPDGSLNRWYELTGDNQEGITVVPRCPSTSSLVYIAEDSGEVWEYGDYPVECRSRPPQFSVPATLP